MIARLDHAAKQVARMSIDLDGGERVCSAARSDATSAPLTERFQRCFCHTGLSLLSGKKSGR